MVLGHKVNTNGACTMSAIPEFISTWIKLQHADQESQQAEELMWAANKLNILCITDPLDAWDLTKGIADETDNEWVLTNLASGPIESLLSMHGDSVISLILEYAGKSEKFKKSLSNVWKNEISDENWEALQNFLGSKTS